MDYYVYILANNTRTVLYTGVTNNLLRRIYEHKTHIDPNSFTARYCIHNLVYFEQVSNPDAAIAREKQIMGIGFNQLTQGNKATIAC